MKQRWMILIVCAALAATACDDDDSQGGAQDATSSGADTNSSGADSNTSGSTDDANTSSGTDTNVVIDTVTDNDIDNDTNVGVDTVTDNDIDSDANNDADTTPIEPLPDPTPEAVTACAELATALCGFIQGCPELAGDSFDYAQCIQLFSDECELGTVLPDSSQTPAVIDACAQTLGVIQCSDVQDIQSFEQLCSVPSGDRANGEGCVRGVQCEALNCNISVDNYPCGTCGPKPPPAQENEPCDGVSIECAEGLVCNTGGQAEGVCQPPPAPKNPGEACDFGEACVEGYACTALLEPGTCELIPTEGQACTFGQTCTEGLVCTADFSAPGTCVMPVPENGDCSATGAICAQGTVCTNGTCQTPQPVAQGGVCVTDDFQLLPCVAGTSCSFMTNTCEPLAQAGEACSDFFGPPCDSRLQCVVPEGDFQGTCAPIDYNACQ